MELKGKLLIFWLFFLGTCQGIFESCDYYQELLPHYIYNIYPPGYPNNNLPGKSCRWFVVSPPKTKIALVCDEFHIPPSPKCVSGGLLVSRNGNIDLSDIEIFCGNNISNVISNENRMNVVLLMKPESPVSSFRCHFEVNEDKPIPHPNPLCNCGKRNFRKIVGGIETGINEYPMMAGLVDRFFYAIYCGATIISSKYVLTAAHCVRKKSPRSIAVLVGEHDSSEGNDTDSAKLYLIQKMHFHENFSAQNYHNDIGLVELKENIIFSREVRPVCLPILNTKDLFVGEVIEALGWGMTNFLGKESNKLLKVGLHVISIERCKELHGEKIFENQICTLEDEKDACQGDSGGPLLWTDPATGMIKILGIISYGIHCASSYPGVNTRVTSYIDWIKDITGEEYCVV